MFLSICIPSYNRFNFLKRNVDSILTAKSDDFEVVIVDNCSDEDVCSILPDDDRIRVIKHKQPISGMKNSRKCVEFGNGEYVLVCLDKDYIDGRYLDCFITELKKENSCSCGYCTLNDKTGVGSLIISRGELASLIYQCRHPSGYFFKREYIVQEKNFLTSKRDTEIFYENAFALDLLYARCLTYGQEAVYKGTLIVPETLENAVKTVSYTYSKKLKNIFFFPEQRRMQFQIFLKYLNELEIESKEYEDIVYDLCKRTLNQCTIGYKKVMKDRYICGHYNVETEYISLRKMVLEGLEFNHCVTESEILYMSKVKENILLFKAWGMLFLSLIKGIIKK